MPHDNQDDHELVNLSIHNLRQGGGGMYGGFGFGDGGYDPSAYRRTERETEPSPEVLRERHRVR